MASHRENRGFHIDTLARVARKTLLNEYLAVPVAAAAVWLTLDSKSSANHLTKVVEHAASLGIKLTSTHIRQVARAALYLGATGAAISLNDLLTIGSANNWTRGRPKEWQDFDREIVVITGGSSGIGENVAKGFLRRNPKTTLVIVDFAPLSWTPPSGTLGKNVHYYQADLSKPDVIRDVCARIRAEIGHPTVLINNAGVARGFTLLEGTYADVEVTLKTNLQAPFLMVKEFLPEMVRTDHGHIVHTCSMSAIVPPPGIVDYAATKAGVQALHEGLQMELRYRYNALRVRLTNVIPNFIRTPLLQGEPAQPRFLAPLLHVETVSEAIVDSVYSGYGKVVYLPGIMRYITMLRASPEWMFRSLIRNGTAELAVGFQGRQHIDEDGGLQVAPNK
ncbi:hypothetical protein B0H66DRAFT_643140 [Apodospora peruviana]|uniref:Uncharacterized protein n=1 Tax=Apodospora peruviana TaxID=516989 RepID=A0AAE0HVF9_9PEZI|nr:hypothetical protein B0H66DRAFT_643140 [Apodospora peruviana]